MLFSLSLYSIVISQNYFICSFFLKIFTVLDNGCKKIGNENFSKMWHIKTSLNNNKSNLKLSSEFSPAKITIYCTPASTNKRQREAAKRIELTHGCQVQLTQTRQLKSPPRNVHHERPGRQKFELTGLLFFSIPSDRQQQANKLRRNKRCCMTNRSFDLSATKYTHSIFL